MDSRRLGRGHRSQLGSPRFPDGRCRVLTSSRGLSAAGTRALHRDDQAIDDEAGASAAFHLPFFAGADANRWKRKRRRHRRAGRSAAAGRRAENQSDVIPTRASQHGHLRRAFGGLCPPKDSRPLWRDGSREHSGWALRSVGGRLSQVRTLAGLREEEDFAIEQNRTCSNDSAHQFSAEVAQASIPALDHGAPPR